MSEQAIPFDAYAARPDPAVAKPMMGVAGSDGENYDAYLTALSAAPETNPALKHPAQFAVYNEMRRSDPAIKSLLWLFKLPIRAAAWTLEPASEDAEDKVVVEAIARQFGLDGHDGRLAQTWDANIAQALLRLDWGSMFEELIWSRDVETWSFDGQDRIIRPLEQLAPRPPATVLRITQDEERGVVVKIEQKLTNVKPITEEKLVVNVFEKEGRNWFGTSVLRPVYGPWRLKRALLVSSAIAWDRWASGLPVVRHPPDDESQKRAEEIGQNVRTHERAYVALPGTAEAGWNLELLNTGTIGDPTPLLRHYDAQIAITGVQQFSVLGRTGSGSRAVGEVQVSPYYMALDTIADQVATDRMQQVFRRFVDVNFGKKYDLPKLRASKIEAEALPTLAAAIADLANAGFSFDDPDTQDDVRERMELPKLPDKLRAKMEELPDNVGVTATPPEMIAPPPPGANQQPQLPPGQKAEGAGLGL